MERTKTIDVNGMPNAATCIQKLLTNDVAEQLPLKSLTVEGSKITFEFGEWEKTYSHIVAKQYSKKKYSEEEFRNNVSQFEKQSNGLLLKGIAETNKIWLAIFSKNKSR